MLEIQVNETGIGIKESDLGKLLKLFGFLDTTRELNTKGIGLGLHISKMICKNSVEKLLKYVFQTLLRSKLRNFKFIIKL